jgi:hypothetical protein
MFKDLLKKLLDETRQITYRPGLTQINAEELKSV